MYKITTPDGLSMTVEKPNYIRTHKNGCLILCDQKVAEGVAHNGTPYLFKDGATCREYDAGADLDSQMTAINGIIKTMLEG